MSRRFPLITAHAGSMDTLAHTLRSVQIGLELGADVIEEDIRVTRDGIPVLAHDDNWVTTDRLNVSIEAMTYEELSGLRLEEEHEEQAGSGAQGEGHGENGGNGEHRENGEHGEDGENGRSFRLLRLEDILPFVLASRKTINLDLKVDAAIEPSAALIREFGLSQQAFFSGCQRERALLAERQQPEMRKLLNTDVELFKTLSYREAMIQTCEDAREAACIGINIYHGILRKEFVDYAAGLGLPVYAWTVNDEAMMLRYADWGIESITTRNVAALVRAKQEWLGLKL